MTVMRARPGARGSRAKRHAAGKLGIQHIEARSPRQKGVRLSLGENRQGEAAIPPRDSQKKQCGGRMPVRAHPRRKKRSHYPRDDTDWIDSEQASDGRRMQADQKGLPRAL